MENFLKSIPGLGPNILQLLRRSEDSLVSLFNPRHAFQSLDSIISGPSRVIAWIDSSKSSRLRADIEYGDDLSTQAEHAVGQAIGEHYFIVNWPTNIRAFYTQPCESDPTICKAFDLMHPRMELSSAPSVSIATRNWQKRWRRRA